MALIYKDRVKETTTTTGTGTLTLAGAVTGYQAFSVIGNGNTCVYVIEDANGTGWEVGIGTYNSSGTTLARTTVLASSNSGSAITLSTGTHSVFVGWDASKALNALDTGLVHVQSDASTTQTTAHDTWTKISTALVTETVDTNGWWDNTNKKLLPTRAGKYLILAGFQFNTTSTAVKQAAIFLNGSVDTYGGGFSAAYANTVVAAICQLNGSTDYAELYMYQATGGTISNFAGTGRVFFKAAFLGE